MPDPHIPISISRYGTRGTNAVCVSIGQIDLYFSYKTVIAFRAPGFGLVISKSHWGPTTGRHLNAISRESEHPRLSPDEFKKTLLDMMASFGLTDVGVDD